KLRSQRRRREEPADDLLPRFDEGGRWADSPAQWSMPADRLLERREMRAMVRAAIEQLPASYRSILLLRDIEELDTEETAASLGITVNAAKIRLHRSRQALKTLLERALLARPLDTNPNTLRSRMEKPRIVRRGVELSLASVLSAPDRAPSAD